MRNAITRSILLMAVASASLVHAQQAGTTLRIFCKTTSDNQSAGHVDITAFGNTCAEAKQAALQEANKMDRCTYQGNITAPGRVATDVRQFLQTNTCPA